MSRILRTQEREVRFLLPPDAVDLDKSARAISILDIYILQKEFSVRLRKTLEGDIELFTLSFKFFNKDYTDEYNIPVDIEMGQGFVNEFEIYRLPRVEKVRYSFSSFDESRWQVDMYRGNLAFLVIAELEYHGPDRPQVVYENPDWYLGKNWGCKEMDVTDDRSFLSRALKSSTEDVEDFHREVKKRLLVIKSEDRFVSAQ